MRRQLSLNLYRGQRGGIRPRAGRKRIRSKGVAHRIREKVTSRTALHVNFKVTTAIRNKQCLKILKRAIKNSRLQGLSIVHFSLQSNHIHLVIEAGNNEILTIGMRSLTITFAKGINKGRFQIERYHLHVLKSLRETKNALHYVLFNQQKHSGMKKAYVDSFSSLGAIKDFKSLAKAVKMTVILSKIEEINFLTPPQGWMLKQVLNQQIG